MARSLFDVFGRLLLEDNGKQFIADAKKAGGQAGGEAGESMGSRISGGLKKAIPKALVGGGAAIGAFVAGSVQEFSKFQQSMNEVFTLLPGITQDAMGKMSQDVEAFSRETGKLPEDVIPALYQAISAGVPPDNVFDFLRTANKNAVGGVTTLTTSVDGLSSVVNAYGADVLSTEKASDIMFTGVRLGKTTIDEMSKSLFQVIPTASALGVQFGDVTAALAAMTAQGVPTNVATTQLRQLFVELSKEGGKTADTFQKITGKSFKEFIAGGGNVQDALQLLEKHAQDTGVGINDLFGSVEAGSAALSLTGKGTETFSNDLAAMGESAGATNTAFTTMDSGIAATTRKIGATIRTMAIDVGRQLQDLGPIFTLFGPAAGRALGAGLGAAFGGVAGLLGKGLGKAFAAAEIGTRLETVGLKASTMFIKGMTRLDGLADKLGSALSSALDKVPGSGALKGASSKLGSLMGGNLGKGLGVAFAAVAVFEVFQTYDRIKGELDAQGAAIGQSVGAQVRTGTLDELKQSQAAIEAGLQQLNGVVDFGLFTTDSRKNLEAQLAAVKASIASKTAEVPPAVAGALAAGAPKVDAGAAAMVDGIDGEVIGAKAGAAAAAAATPQEVADGLRSGRDAVKSAMAQLASDIENTLTRTQEAARIAGDLTGKQLAQGLASKDPVVRAQAEATKKLMVDRLVELAAAGGPLGKKAMDELNTGIRSKNPVVRAAAQAAKEAVEAKLNAIKGRPAGAKAGEGVHDGLLDKESRIGNAAWAIGQVIYKRIWASEHAAAGTSTRMGARAAGGPVEAGQPYIVGEHRPELFVPDVPGTILPSVPTTSAPASTSSGSSFTQTNHISVMAPSVRRTPMEIATQLRRITRPGTWEPEGTF